jgi:hypothetical protein
MKWTLGLLLVGAVGCGYRQTRMVACPETGCPATYASSSPEGLPGPTRHQAAVTPPVTPELYPPVPPLTPEVDAVPPPVTPPVSTP